MPIGHTPEPSGLLDRAYRFVTRIGSRLPNARDRVPPPAELEKFRTAQRTAYECVTQVATRLREGITERETAELLKKHLSDRGITRYLHTPFAWFGEHAAFDGYANYADYHASDRKLREGEAVVLDVSPMVDGYIGWPGGGAKFEELLVVEPHRAWWLDDDVPHMGVG